MTTPINPELYKQKFKSYPDDLLEFSKTNNLTLPDINSMKGQALALLSQPEVKGQLHVSRKEAVQFFQNIGMVTQDAIQQFNKPTGLTRVPKKGAYCLKYPFECDTTHLDKRKGAIIQGDKDTSVNTIKQWWRKNLIDIPNEEWQIGHLDPTIDDASEKNLAYQPPLQGKYRDRFKWDKYFHKMWPTATELLSKLNHYYTEAEQQLIYQALQKKFKKSPKSPKSES